MKIDIRKYSRERGLTLIELIVAIFIFSLITVAIVSVFASTMKAYQKARAIKLVKENAEFAISSIAKGVRMGKIEFTDSNCIGAGASPKACLMISRNRGGEKICYRIASNYLGIQEGVSTACSSSESAYKKIVDLSGTNMTFDTLTSGFYSLPTDVETSVTPERRRGWVEINFNIKSALGREMETDQINVQTIVSSRDYGWEEVP